MTTFNEDSRVKIPALLHLSRLGYDYLSLKQARWDTRSNILPELFEAALLRLTPELHREDLTPCSTRSTSTCRTRISARPSTSASRLVYFQLTGYLDHFKMMAEKRKTTMGHITLDNLRQSFVVIPPVSLVERLDESLRPMLDQYVGLNKQSQKLVELRDWLLPLLMNGQVRAA